MFSLLTKKCIKNYQMYEQEKVRESYGILCCIISIITNSILVLFMIALGHITHSVSMQANGLNNLSDVGSNIAVLFSFKLASKHPDRKHPYGHGRLEYVSGLIISFLIIIVGFQSIKESLFKIVNPEPITFNYGACIVLVVGALAKIWMGWFHHTTAKKIQSQTLLAVAQESLNDVYMFIATLLAFLLSLVTTLPLDGIFGTIVSMIIIRSGFTIFKDTLDSLLGKAPDPTLITEIEQFVLAYPVALGVHDIILHDYGPGRKFLTLHVEIDSKDDIMQVHNSIDDIERALQDKFHIMATIHMDPLDISDPLTRSLKQQVEEIVSRLHSDYSVHDFRIVHGSHHFNLIFDVLLPAKDGIDHQLVKSQIDQEIKAINPTYETIIKVEHSYQ